MKRAQARNIDDYISDFPKEVQEKLEKVRATIKQIAPEAVETIKYAMPTFMLKGKNLVFFAGFKNHIGFYPTPLGLRDFEKDLSHYKTGKGSIQFPLDQPIPYNLIEKIVKFRMEKV